MTKKQKEPTPDEYLKSCVTIEQADLQGEFVRVSSDLSYWNHRYAESCKRLLLAELARKKLHAALWLENKVDTLGKSGKAPTLDDLKAMVELDINYREAKAEEIEAEVEKEELRGVVEAIRTKKEMLISLGAHIRAEMNGNPQINSQN